MKIHRPKTVTEELNVTHIKCELPVRYDEEDIPNDFPGRSGDLLELLIDVDSEKIVNWPADRGRSSIDMKVVDGGNYYLMSGDKVLASLEGEYVPPCIPEGGDYIVMEIESDGLVSNLGNRMSRIIESFFS